MQMTDLSVERKYPYLIENKILTKREMEVLYWLKFGKTTQMVADILGIKQRTIKAHIANIKQKTNCQTLFQVGYFYAKIYEVHDIP